MTDEKKHNESLENQLNLDDFNQLVKFICNENDETIRENVSIHIFNIIKNVDYSVLFLCKSVGMIDDSDSDNIYSQLQDNKEKNILLILNSTGGRIEPAYLISRCCKERAKDKFVVSIPRRAKSAATLIALGADEIHMGSLSEIGPIDPQMRGLPALGLSSALECLARLCKKYPESSSMFAEYLAKNLPLDVLGYFERISESAEHYATRLLQNRKRVNNINIEEIARKLTYEYKDHSFVIDKDESKTLFGDDIVKIETNEYKIGNKIYSFLEKVNFVYSISKRKIFNLSSLHNEEEAKETIKRISIQQGRNPLSNRQASIEEVGILRLFKKMVYRDYPNLDKIIGNLKNKN